jgi:hypothetical protein
MLCWQSLKHRLIATVRGYKMSERLFVAGEYSGARVNMPANCPRLPHFSGCPLPYADDIMPSMATTFWMGNMLNREAVAGLTRLATGVR